MPPWMRRAHRKAGRACEAVGRTASIMGQTFARCRHPVEPPPPPPPPAKPVAPLPPHIESAVGVPLVVGSVGVGVPLIDRVRAGIAAEEASRKAQIEDRERGRRRAAEHVYEAVVRALCEGAPTHRVCIHLDKKCDPVVMAEWSAVCHDPDGFSAMVRDLFRQRARLSPAFTVLVAQSIGRIIVDGAVFPLTFSLEGGGGCAAPLQAKA